MEEKEFNWVSIKKFDGSLFEAHLKEWCHAANEMILIETDKGERFLVHRTNVVLFSVG